MFLVMKTIIRSLLIVLSLCTAAILQAASGPSFNVTVTDAGGKVIYKGRTGPNGTFSTGKVKPGDYVVQFNSQSASGQYSLVVSAGKQKTVAEAVSGAKMARGGVAMRLKSNQEINITGQVSSARAGVAAGNGAGNVKVKIINGVRYVWAGPSTGSNLGGHWVEENSPEGRNVTRMSADGIQSVQDRGLQGGVPGN